MWYVSEMVVYHYWKVALQLAFELLLIVLLSLSKTQNIFINICFFTGISRKYTTTDLKVDI